MKKHDFGAWFLLCELLFLFAPGVSAMAEETEPLFAFAAQAEEVRPGGSFAVTCTPARGDIGAFVLFADFDAEVIVNAKAELPESVKSRHVPRSRTDVLRSFTRRRTAAYSRSRSRWCSARSAMRSLMR